MTKLIERIKMRIIEISFNKETLAQFEEHGLVGKRDANKKRIDLDKLAYQNAKDIEELENLASLIDNALQNHYAHLDARKRYREKQLMKHSIDRIVSKF
jgi:hypothetical protein